VVARAKAFGALLAVATVIATVSAQAEAPVAAPNAAESREVGDASEHAPAWPREHWYGWQTLATDGAAASQFALAVPTHNVAFVGLGAGTFLLGAPIVHLVHHKPWLALLDLGFRVAVPFVGVAVGADMDSRTPGHCYGSPDIACEPSTKYIEIGGAISMATVAALDAAFFSYEPARPEQPRYGGGGRWVLAPSVALVPRGGRVGLSGSF